MWKPLSVWVTTNCGKFLKRWEYLTTSPVSWESCMWVKKQQLQPDKEQWNGWKLGKENDKAVYAEYIILICRVHNTKCQAEWITSWNQNNLRYADDTTLMAESKEELKSLLMMVKEESEKADFKLNIQITKITASGPITSWANRWGNNGDSDRLYFLGLQNNCGQGLQPWN